MDPQSRVGETIFVRGADDLLALKENRRSLAEAVAPGFGSPEARARPLPLPLPSCARSG